MGVLSKIEEVRKKPEAVRERIAMVLTAGITIGLFLFWIFDFTMTGGGAASGTASSTAPSPFDILGNNFDNLVEGAKEQFKTE